MYIVIIQIIYIKLIIKLINILYSMTIKNLHVEIIYLFLVIFFNIISLFISFYKRNYNNINDPIDILIFLLS